MKRTHEAALPATLHQDDWYESWKPIERLAHTLDYLNGGTEQDAAFLANLIELKGQLDGWITELSERVERERSDDEWLADFYRRNCVSQRL